MKINIRSDDGTVANARVELEDGTELRHVTHIAIDADGGRGTIEAKLTFWLPKIDLKGIPATISDEHLRELADANGFDLVKRDGPRP